MNDWTKIILWKTANGWIATDSNTIWESSLGKYYIFSDLTEFTKFITKAKSKRLPKRDNKGKFLKAA